MNKIFETHPKLDAYYETSDGVKFFTKEDAQTHASSLENKKVKKVGRPAKQPAKKPETTAKDRIEAIMAMTDIKQVEKAMEGETAATVKKAGVARIKALEEALASKNKDTGEGKDTGDGKDTGNSENPKKD